jgi:cobalt-zinc-cadmium efflux system membrane fusion protein
MSHPTGPLQSRALGRRTQLLIICGVGVALALALGVAHLLSRHPAPPLPPPLAPGEFRATPEEQANITVAPAQVRDVSDVVVTDGKVATNDDRTTQIFPPFTGRVTHVYVTAGESVRQGQPLASFAANEVIQAQSDLVSARGAERQAAAQLAQAKTNFERQQELYKADAAAQKDFEQSRTDLAAAQQGLANAHAASAAAEGRVGVLNLSTQLPALSRAADKGKFLHEGTIVSPIAGVVTLRQVGEGQFVNSVQGGASQPLLSVSDTRSLWLVANLRDTDAQAVRMGAPVHAHVDALGGREVTGRIDYVAPVVDPNSRRVLVHAVIPNPDGQLRPEMFAEISIATGPVRTALAVPQSAIVYDGPTARVWVAKPNGVFGLRVVTPGISQDGFVEIRSGLAPGERVAVGGALFLDEAGKGDQ